MAETNQETTSGSKPSSEAGVAAGQKSRQAFQDWRQRMAGAPPFPPGGPAFGGFPMPPTIGFPPGFGTAPPALAGQSAAAGSLFNSLTTTLRLALDLINANLQGMLASGVTQGGGCGHGGGCGCEQEHNCCEHFGSSCGCCRPSVNNCG